MPSSSWVRVSESYSEYPPFVKIVDNGRIVVRIVGNPFSYGVHYYPDKSGQLRRGFCTGKGCIYCTNTELTALARRPSMRYSMWVIQGDNLAILEIGNKLFQVIGKVVKEISGPTEEYDIGIIKTGKGYNTVYNVDVSFSKKYDDSFWQEIRDKIQKFSMRALVGDTQAREVMKQEIEEEDRILNKSW